MSAIPWALFRIPKSRVWFYRPEWFWGGLYCFWPIWSGHDDYSRVTLVLGWPFTGRMVIALRYCGDRACYKESIRVYEDERRHA